MFEITINEAVYPLNFGMGFLREIDKRVSAPVDGMHGVKQDMGLRYAVASIIDGDPKAVVDVLELANKGQTPRLTKAALDAFVEDENTDIDALFEDVKGFLSKANVTKKVTLELLGVAEAQREKAGL